MRIQRTILIIILSFITHFAIIAPPSHAAVQDKSDDFTLSYVIQANGFELNLTPVASDEPDVRYRPNVRSIFGFQLSYQGYAIAAMFDTDPSEEEEQLKGKTSYEDIRGGFFLGKKNQFPILGYYNRYDDLYIENSEEIDNTITAGQPRIQRDDISVFNAGLTAMYIFSPENFSAAAAFLQSARQTKSGGSFLFTLSLDATKFSADEPLVPTQLQSDFGADALVTEGEFITLAASFGFGYTFVFLKNGFATGTLLWGEGLQQRKYTVAGNETNGTAKGFKSSMGLSLGWNADRYFLGWTHLFDQTNYETETVEFKSELQTNRIFAGLRF